MAPLCEDPRQIIITLEPAQRQALLRLVQEIIKHMISQWQTPYEELGPVDTEEAGGEVNKQQGTAGDAAAEGPRVKSNPPPHAHNSKKAEHVQRAALMYALEWRDEILTKLDEIVSVADKPKIIAERKKRRELLQQQQSQQQQQQETTTTVNFAQRGTCSNADALRKLYRPLPTKLDTISRQYRKEALSCILVLLLSTGKYSAHSRILILHLASALHLSKSFVDNEEAEIATSLIQSASASASGTCKEAMSAEAETEKRRHENKVSRFWKVGLASVAGAAVIGVTGGLAAPLVAGALGGILGGLGLGGVASFLGVFWANSALVGTLFGAFGAKMTGGMMDKYAKEVEDFCFVPILDDEAPKDLDDRLLLQSKRQRRLRVTIGVSGWLDSEDDITNPWRVLSHDTERFALRYETHAMLAFGKALHDFIQSMAWKTLKTQIITRTVLHALWAALWPIQVLSVASTVDNPFHRASNRSHKAGELLADALINRAQGERPVTLLGYSCGALAIHACLKSLAQRQAFGLVESVVLLGTPAPSDAGHWRAIRPVVSGGIYNVFSENDMVLAFVYRVHSLEMGVAGLQAIRDVSGVENVDLSDRVSGHLRYASLTGEILRRCGFDGVRAGDEIEKDDVIKLQELHAEQQHGDERDEEDEAQVAEAADRDRLDDLALKDIEQAQHGQINMVKDEGVEDQPSQGREGAEGVEGVPSPSEQAKEAPPAQEHQ